MSAFGAADLIDRRDIGHRHHIVGNGGVEPFEPVAYERKPSRFQSINMALAVVSAFHQSWSLTLTELMRDGAAAPLDVFRQFHRRHGRA